MSGYAEDAGRVDPGTLVGDGVVQKPFSVVRLLQRIRNVLDGDR